MAEYDEMPSHIKQGLIALAKLKGVDFQELKVLVENQQPALRPGEFARNVVKLFEKPNDPDIYAAARTVLALSSAYQAGGQSVEVFVETILQGELELDLDVNERSTLQQRIMSMIGLDSVAITAKAFDVMAAHEHVFSYARVLTDIRPIFMDKDLNGKSSKSWATSVVVHTLQLNYSKADRAEEIYIALDEEDVSNLRRLLNEADNKARELKSVLTGTNMPYLEINHEQPNNPSE